MSRDSHILTVNDLYQRLTPHRVGGTVVIDRSEARIIAAEVTHRRQWLVSPEIMRAPQHSTTIETKFYMGTHLQRTHKVASFRHRHYAASQLCATIYGLLKGCRIVRLAVADSTE